METSDMESSLRWVRCGNGVSPGLLVRPCRYIGQGQSRFTPLPQVGLTWLCVPDALAQHIDLQSVGEEGGNAADQRSQGQFGERGR